MHEGGADTNDYWDRYNDDWDEKSNHKGFDVAANRILIKVNDYLARYNLSGNVKKSILITGHSRGAAIANLLGAYFEDNSNFTSYTYTFAAPNPTTDSNASNYKTIFNIINKDDIIPCLPLEDWGFTKYGVKKSISVEAHYENKWGKRQKGTWEWLVGKDYNNDGGTDRTLKYFSKTADTREDLYKTDYSSDARIWYTNTNSNVIQDSLNKFAKQKQELEKYKLLKFCKISVGRNAFDPKDYTVQINICPAYFMQSLANMTTGVGPMLGRDVKGKYREAKASFVKSSGQIPVLNKINYGGMEDPHTPITYYLIAYNDFVDKV